MIIQSIRRLVAGKRSQPAPVMVRRPIKPMWFDRSGHAHIRPETIARLEHLHSLGFLYREQLEGAAAECCELLGIDPDYDTLEANWCKDIVEHGSEVSTVIGYLLDRRKREAGSDYYSQSENA